MNKPVAASVTNLQRNQSG